MQEDRKQLIPSPLQKSVSASLRIDLSPRQAIVVKFAFITGLLGFSGWCFQNFLSLRGVVDVAASRVFLTLMCVGLLLAWWITAASFKRFVKIAISILIIGAIFGIDWWAPKQSRSPSDIKQRFLPEDKLAAMSHALWIGKGREIMLMHDGSIEARGFSKQIESMLTGTGWIVNGSGERFPFIGPKQG